MNRNRYPTPRQTLALAVVLALGSMGCTPRERPRALGNDAYVWQRNWNEALLAAMTESAASVDRWRVLAAEAGSSGELVKIAVHRQALRRLGQPVIAVIRIDGRNSNAPLSEGLAKQSTTLLADWRKYGVPVRGLELDYDCPNSRLGQYREFLPRLRAQLPRDVALSITALPSWIGSRELPDLLAEVDETVLQVHSVMNPQQGLFDRAAAYRWAQAWSKESSVRFRLALPTYWSRVTWNADGRVAAIESEVARYGAEPASRELIVQPADVAALVAQLRRAPPRSLTEIAWFRLPTAADRRAWSASTWRAVMHGCPVPAALPVVHFKTDPGGASDVYLVNASGLDAKLPSEVLISAPGCESADALPPYDGERETGRVRFRLRSADLLRAGEQRMIGWVRCASEKLEAHVTR